MKRKSERIIFICIIVMLVITNIVSVSLLLKEKRTLDINIQENNKKVKKFVGVYHTSNWDKHEATMILNEDMTCKFNSRTSCTWEIKDDKTLEYAFTNYYIITDEKTDYYYSYGTLESCKKNLESNLEYYSEYNDVHCEGVQGEKVEVTVVNNGILIHDILFNKIGE